MIGKKYILQQEILKLRNRNRNIIQKYTSYDDSSLIKMIKSKSSYIFVGFVFLLLLGINILFYIYRIDILYIFNLSDDSLLSVLNTRTTNVVVITSITLVLIGQVVGNLKEGSSTIINSVFYELYVYPIVFLAMYLLISYFCLSVSFGTLGNPLFKNLLITLNFVAIIYTILIVYLFINFVKYSDSEDAILLMNKRLHLFTIKKLVRKYAIKKVEDRIEKNIKSKGLKINFIAHYDFYINSKERKEGRKYRIIEDINEGQFNKYVKMHIDQKIGTIKIPKIGERCMFDTDDYKVAIDEKEFLNIFKLKDYDLTEDYTEKFVRQSVDYFSSDAHIREYQDLINSLYVFTEVEKILKND